MFSSFSFHSVKSNGLFRLYFTLLLFIFSLIGQKSMGQTTVTYTMQTGNFNTLNTEKNNNPPYAGTYNNGASELAQYCNGGSFGNTPGAAAFQTFSTSGDGVNGTARTMKVGDRFSITVFTGSNPSSGGRIGISFRNSTSVTNFFSSTDANVMARFQLDNSGGWKIYNGGTTRENTGATSGSDRTLVLEVTSDTTFNATIAGTTYYDLSFATTGPIAQFSIYSFGDNNPNSFWKSASMTNFGHTAGDGIRLGYGLTTGNGTIAGIISDGFNTNSTSTTLANRVLVGGSSGTSLTLSKANTYTDSTTVNANATLKLGISSTSSSSGPVGTTGKGTSITSGGVLDMNGFSLTSSATEQLSVNGTGISSGGALINGSGTASTFAGNVSLGSSSSVGGSGDLTLSGTITNSTSGRDLTKIGAGTLTLSGNSSSSWTNGSVAISNGTLSLTSLANNTASRPITIGGSSTAATLSYGGSESSNATNFTIGSAGGTFINTTNSNATTLSESVTLNGTLTLRQNGTSDNTWSGAISGTGGIIINSTGSGKTIFSGTGSTYSGTTTLTAGTLVLGSADALPNGSVLSLGGGIFSTGSTTGYGDTMSTIALTNDAAISLGSGSHNLVFSASNGVGWTSAKILTINGWSGTAGSSGTAGKIFVGTSSSGLTSTQLGQISFTGFGAATLLSTGELVPSANPSIVVGSVTAFSNQCVNTNSAEKSFAISGSSLSADVIVKAPAGFEISTTSGSGFVGSTDSLTLTPSSGTLASTTIYVRFSPTAGTSYSANITVSSTGATTQNVAVSGTGLATPSTVTTPSSVSVTSSSATLGGNLTDEGCADVTEQGIYYSTTNGFADGAGTKVSSTGSFSTGTFTESVTGLTPSTTYYYKAFATTNIGTSYTSQGSFTTLNDISTADFRSAATGDWSSASTWQYNSTGSTYITATQAPGADNNVTIQSSHTVTLDVNATVNSSKSVTVAGVLNLGTNVISGDGSFSTSSGSTLRIGSSEGISSSGSTGNIQTASRSFSAGANYVYNGSVNQETGSGLPSLSTGSLIISNSGSSSNNIVTLTNNGTSVPTLSLTSGIFSAGSGDTLKIVSGGTLSSTGGDLSVSEGVIRFLGTGTVSGTVSFYDVQINGGVNFGSSSTVNGVFTLSSGGFISTNAPSYATNSTLRYNTGGSYGRFLEWDATSGKGYPYNLQISGNTTLNVNNSSNTAKQIGGTLTIDAGSTFSMEGMTIASPTEIGVTILGDVVNNGTVTLSTTTERLKCANFSNNSGATTILSSSSGGDLELTGSLIDNATFTANTRAVFFSGSGVQDISGSGTFNIDYIVMNKPSGRVRLLNNLLTEAPNTGNALSFSSATDTLDLNGYVMTLGKSSSQSAISGTGVIRGGGNSGLVFLGTGAVGTLRMDQSEDGTSNVLGRLTLNRTSTGSLTLGNKLQLDTLTLTNGTLDIASQTLKITGSSLTRSSGVLDGDAGTIEWANAASQSLPSGLFSGSVNNWTMNGGGGLSLGAATTITGTLTLTDGLLTLGSNNLTLGSAATVSGTPGSTNMIVATGAGQLRKNFSSTGSFTFPVGDASGTTEYSPVSVNVTSGSFGADAYVSAQVTNSKHPNNASATDYISRYWTITQSGLTSFGAVVEGEYTDDDVTGTEGNLSMGKWSGSLPWTLYSASVNTGQNKLTSGTVSSFSDFSGLSAVAPTVSASADDDSVCLGTSVTISTTASGDGSLSYSWSPGGATTSSITVTPGSTTDYIVTLTDGNGQTAKDTVKVVILQPTSSDTTASACNSFSWYGNSYTASGDYDRVITNTAGCDSTITLSLTINTNSSSSQTIIATDSYTWNGNTYTASGIYTFTASNSNGCDSIVTLNLTITTATFRDTSATACVSFNWYGTNYTNSGVYTYTLANANSQGADSIIILTLTILNPTSTTLNASGCTQYVLPWNVTVNQTGSYSNTYTGANGCDSIVTINVTINQPQSSSFDVSSCETYSLPWGGTVNASGNYSHVYQNQFGCDSTVTANVTILVTKYTTQNVSSCISYTLPWGPSVTIGGAYNHTYTAADGCDSIVTINLTLYNTTTSTTNVSACYNTLPYLWNGVSYNSAGTYSDTFVNVNGCDSIAILNLTVTGGLDYYNLQWPPSGTICSEGVYTVYGQAFEANVTATPGQSTGLIAELGYSTSNSNPANWTNWIPAIFNGQVGNNDEFKAILTGLPAGTYYYTFRYKYQDCNYEYGGYSSTGGGAWNGTSNVNGVLTVNNGGSNKTIASACSNYVWNNVTYTASGIYTRNYTGANGCAAVDSLILTINTPSSSSESATACGSYSWNGTTYLYSGEYDWYGTNAAGCDSIVSLSLEILETNNDTISVNECSASYTWNGNTYSSSGYYTYTGTNQYGCDSTVTLNLTFGSPSASTTNVTACDSYTWNGQVYNQSGSYTFNATNASGCDSTATLNLTINESNNTSLNVVACDSYVWNSNTYTVSGNYTNNTINQYGCDSTVTLSLQINASTTSTQLVISNDPYVWNGNTYASSGTYTYTTTNAAGCDSVATLNLTITTATYGDTTAVACDSFLWYGNNYTTSGDYTHILDDANAQGADSIIVLHLTINNSTSQIINVTGCDSYTLPWGVTVTASGTYSFTYQNIKGCDSVLHYQVTINASQTSSENMTSCDSLNLPWGVTVYSSGNYSHTYTGLNGCDSVVTKSVVINASQSTNLTQTACNSYTLPWGTTVSASGTYSHTYVAANGCDSIVNVQLLINTSSSTTVNETVCFNSLPYVWNGQTINAAGAYTAVLSNQNGCDSTVTLNLSVSNGIDYANLQWPPAGTICSGGSYTVYGQVYEGSITPAAGQGSGITVEVGYNNTNTDPSTWTNWSAAEFNGQSGNNDEYKFTFAALPVGTYYYTFRYKIDDCNYQYGGYSSNGGGFWDGSTNINGTLVISGGSSVTVTQQACGSYTWFGTTYNSSGTYTYSYSNSYGCPSTDTLLLTILDNTTSSTSATACDSYVWNGTTYTTSGVKTFITTNAAGCDSVASLNLTINNSTTSTTIQSACNSFTWNGTAYSASGTYTWSGINAVGCDSTATLNLTINTSSSSSVSETACNSYVFNGTTYTVGGEYIWTGTNAAGCDSVVTLTLTINSPSSSSDTVSACTSYTWNGTTYTTSGNYTFNTTNSNGCDSVANLALTINTCNTTLNLNAFIEGFYSGSSIMVSSLYDQGISTDVTATDTITVNLHASSPTVSATPSYSVKVILHNNGTATAIFPGATLGNSYYIALKHRNHMETWSAAPVTFSSTNSYNFTDSVSSAYSDGVNAPMKSVSGGKYALYAGDVNQDGTIDLFDLLDTENDASNFTNGYNASDVNGDATSDLFDLILIENNSTLFIFVANPVL